VPFNSFSSFLPAETRAALLTAKTPMLNKAAISRYNNGQKIQRKGWAGVHQKGVAVQLCSNMSFVQRRSSTARGLVGG